MDLCRAWSCIIVKFTDQHLDTLQVKEVIPDAVKSTGDVTLHNGEKIENFLLVNKVIVIM